MRRPSGQRPRRLALALIGVLAIGAGVSMMGPASGQTGPQVVSTPGNGIVDQQFLAVSITGFPATTGVRVHECPVGATALAACHEDSLPGGAGRDAGDSRFGRTNANGAVDLSFFVKAGEMTSNAGERFFCDADNGCQLVVQELDIFGDPLGFDKTAKVTLGFGASTVPCEQPKNARARVAGSGGTTPLSAIIEWQSETCVEPLRLDLSYSVINSPSGKENYIRELDDSSFAASGIELTPEEKTTLTAQGRTPVHMPISVGGLGFVYNYWEDLDRCDDDDTRRRVEDFRLSPEVVARIMTGQIRDMSDPLIAADNAHILERTKLTGSQGSCDEAATKLPAKVIQAVGRADQSAATWTLTSWLAQTAKEAFEKDREFPDVERPEYAIPRTTYPAGRGIELRTGSNAVARLIRLAESDPDGSDRPAWMWIGFVDTSVAIRVGLPVAQVKNAAGAYTKPDSSGLQAALTAATLNADGTVTPNYAPTTEQAYPLPTVSYLIADQCGGMTKPRLKTFKAFVAYALTSGQDAAADRGYLPLPSELRSAAATNAESMVARCARAGSGGAGGGAGGKNGGKGGAVSGSPRSGSLDDDDDDGAPQTAADDLVDDLGEVAQTGSSGVGPSSPVAGGDLGEEALGAAGGPAGVVRALSVLLGAPVLVALGVLCLAVGLSSEIKPYLASLMRAGPRRRVR